MLFRRCKLRVKVSVALNYMISFDLRAFFGCVFVFFAVPVLCFFAGGPVQAQVSSHTVSEAPADTAGMLRAVLGEVYIEASRMPVIWERQPVQVSLLRQDAAEVSAASSLGDVLRFGSPVMIRRYGLGGIQSVSARGFGARQTSLMWNGFGINHAMLGETDYNLIPAGFASNIRVATGNSSAGFGEGSTAGSVLFDSPAPANRTSFSAQTGAWGQRHFGFQSGFRGPVFRASLHLSGAQAVNNYPYFDDIRQREEFRRNNQFQNRHALLSAGFTRGSWQYDGSLWLGAAEHHISGSSAVRNPRAVQTDGFTRWTNLLALQQGRGLWQLSSFHEWYRLDYLDAPSRIESLSDLGRHQLRLVYRREAAAGLFLSAGADAGQTTIDTNNYSGTETRRHLSVFAQAEYRPVEPLTFYPVLRLLSWSDFGEALTGSFGANWRTPLRGLHLRGQLARNFNPPGLNDLYWSPGGNPELKPEESTSLEGGLAYTRELRGFRTRAGLTLYRIWFENGIRWLPGPGGIWSPVNLFEIDSRGAEADLSASLHWQGWVFTMDGALARTRATSPRQETVDGELRRIDRQLTYVPEWSWKAGLGLSKFGLFANASLQQVGSRFTTADHSAPNDPLGAFADLSLQLGYGHQFRAADVRLAWTLHNLTDGQHQFISRYPLPPRYHTLSLRIGFRY